MQLTISRLAKAAGVNVQTVRYYERRKLLSPMRGCPGEAWARKAYEIFQEESEGIDQSAQPPCCDHS